MLQRLASPAFFTCLLSLAACSATSSPNGATTGTSAGGSTSTSAGTAVTSSTGAGASGAGGSTTSSAGSGGASTTAGAGGASTTAAGPGGASTTTAGTGGTTSTAAGTGGGTSTSAGNGGGATTLIRVHYPAGSHPVTIRGSAGGLSWTQGQAPASTSGDTFTYAVASLTAAAEWKPLLDDTTWALGPNYHVSPGETVDVWPHFTSTSGQVVTLIAAFKSTVLSNTRPIYAYLPASYSENTDATYPVVYMHDGQNLWAADPSLSFDMKDTWEVDTAFDTASNTGACSAGGVVGWGAQPLGGTPVTCNGDGDCPSGECRTFPEAIVIGVANAGAARIYEYTPTTDTSNPGGGGADQYLKMLVTELKPTIDGMLRTRPGVASTVMTGSSLGGLVTAYAGIKYPSVYGRVGALSPSTWWSNDVIIGDVQGTPAAPARPLTVYVDCGQGAADVDDQPDTDMLAAAYTALGYGPTSFRYVTQPGAVHSEVYWAERFPGAMQFLLGAR